MQTFLPDPEFAASAALLDTPRLGKQRVETLQILRALTLPEYGWRNHPAVVMWRGRVDALVRYGLDCVDEWRRRGFPDTTAAQIAEFAPDVVNLTQDDLQAAGRLPGWLGRTELHRSHRSKLLGKDPDHYAPLFGRGARTPAGATEPGLDDVLPDDLDYVWPGADPGPARPTEEPVVDPATCWWIVNPTSADRLGRLLLESVIGLGAETGVTQDATGLSLADLRATLDPPTSRVTRPLLALSRLLQDVEPGRRVGIQIAHGRQVLAGEVTGDYGWTAARSATAAHADPIVHRREVHWHSVVDRARFRPPALLQDPRPLFAVPPPVDAGERPDLRTGTEVP